MLTGLEALRGPARVPRPGTGARGGHQRCPAAPGRGSQARTTRTRRDEAEHEQDPAPRAWLAGSRPGPVLAAAASEPCSRWPPSWRPSPLRPGPRRRAAPAALAAPVAAHARRGPAVDPASEKAVAFLTALRDADIPTSRSGTAETEAAAAICQQLDQGADEAQLRVAAGGADRRHPRQASDGRGLRPQHYC